MMLDNTPIRIKKLSPLLINQLAAGEVVTRPAAVVKELLENAIDAGATHIEVRITQGGMSMIEVSDNGTGIHPDDMVMAITRHATSKVADIANLQGITTLGFRGEALAATAAVSRLSLVSSHDDSGIGRQLHVAGILSELPKLTPVVRTQGTTVTVKDLYFNVPARRGNLKSMATEFGHIESIVRDVALACADVSLDLFHDNKKRLSLLAASGSQKSRLPLSRLEQALGRGLSAHAHAISVDLSSLITDAEHARAQAQAPISAQITGWVWTSNESTPPQLIYVNGRLIKEVLIVNELRKLAARFLLERLGYALYFELPASWLNVNVHPSKQRIKISPLNNVMAHLTHSVSSLLSHTQPAQIQTSSKTPVLPQPHTDAPVVGNQDAVQAARPRSIKLSDYKVDQSPPSPPRSARSQVAAPRQRYQASDSDHSASNAIALDAKASDSVLHEPPSSDWRNRVLAALPQCIAVITTLPAAATLSESDTQPEDMPWLLFSYQGQLMLMAESTWQANAATVFEHSWSLATKGSVTVTKINQQMAHASAQTTNQDGDNVIAALTDVLSVSAIACITTEQLVALMLSSSTL